MAENWFQIENIFKIEVPPIAQSLPSEFTTRSGKKLSDFAKNAFLGQVVPYFSLETYILLYIRSILQ